MLKNKPERTCSCCRKKFAKGELIRVVKDGDKFFVDRTGKASGRGSYVCKNKACLQNLLKNKSLNRSFKTAVPNEVYQEVLDFASELER